MKLKDFESDEEEDDQTEDERNEMEPATKKFCEFLSRQSPQNTFSSLLKTYANQQCASEYALRNFRLYNMTINHFKTESINTRLRPSNRSFSTPNLSEINTIIQINRSKSLARLDSEELREDFIEINSIRVGLEKLHSILTDGNPKSEATCNQKESEEKMEVAIVQENPSNSIRHSGNHFKKYITNIEALKEEVKELSSQKNDLEKRNEELHSLLIDHQNKQEHPAEYHITLNSMVIKCNELVAENQILNEHNANTVNQLEYYRTKLNEKYNSDLELTQRKINSLTSFNQELEVVNQSLREQMEYYRGKANEHYSAMQLSQKQVNLLQLDNQSLKERNANLQQKTEQLQNHCQELNNQLAMYQKTVNKLEYDQETLKMQLENMRASYSELYNVELAPCKERVNLLLLTCSEKENQIQILGKQLMDYEKQMGSYQDQYSEKVKSQFKLTQDYNALLEKYNQLNNHCLKIQCDLDVVREKDKILLESLDNYEQKTKKLQTDSENHEKILKAKDLELQTCIDERKKMEDKLTLSQIKISQLEETIKTIKNQKSKVLVSNSNEEKKVEEYRKEILSLKKAQEQVNQHERRIHDLLHTNKKLETQHKSLADELEAVKANLHQEITLRKETSQKLKVREQVLRNFRMDYHNITQSHIKHVELNKEKIRKIQELEEKISHLKTENKNLQDTIRLKICNSIQKAPETEDSFKIITKFKNTINGCDNEDVATMKMKLKKAEQTNDILVEKDKQITQLKSQLADFNMKLENAQKNLESAKGSCECKNATRTSLSNRRRHEKNLLQDSRRNIPSEDIKNDVVGQEKRS